MGFNVLKLFEESLRPDQDGESSFVGSPLILGRVGKRRSMEAPAVLDPTEIKRKSPHGALTPG